MTDVPLGAPIPNMTRPRWQTRPESYTPDDPQAGASFASPEAAELANKLGVTTEALEQAGQSGKKGHTTDDVRKAHGLMGTTNTED